jgi:GNAT superfamily N-acetyltransferase
VSLANGEYGVPDGKLAVIVTYLEMHDRAATREVSLPEGITFRQIKPDLAWYRDVFTRVGAQDWLWYGRLNIADTALQAILDDPEVEFFTLSKDGTDEALLELDFRQGGACELAYFGLTAELIGAGAGRYLMNQAIARAWDNTAHQRAVSRFHVHTCTHDSPQALPFYIRSGFAPYKRAVDIDDDPRLTGVLPATAAAWIPAI